MKSYLIIIDRDKEQQPSKKGKQAILIHEQWNKFEDQPSSLEMKK